MDIDRILDLIVDEVMDQLLGSEDNAEYVDVFTEEDEFKPLNFDG